MIVFVSLKVSDPLGRTDFALELKILIFVQSEKMFDLHIGIKMEKAASVFLHLASTSSVSPVVVIRLPRYVKAVTHLRIFHAQLMLPVFARDRILISLVLVAFTFSPTLAACVRSASNF